VNEDQAVEHLDVTPDLFIDRILSLEKAQHVRFEICEKLDVREIQLDDGTDPRPIVDAVITAMLAIENPRDVVSLLIDGSRGFNP
jgi:hypothetical protein